MKMYENAISSNNQAAPIFELDLHDTSVYQISFEPIKPSMRK
jgi:hypothetical protein